VGLFLKRQFWQTIGRTGRWGALLVRDVENCEDTNAAVQGFDDLSPGHQPQS